MSQSGDRGTISQPKRLLYTALTCNALGMLSSSSGTSSLAGMGVHMTQTHACSTRMSCLASLSMVWGRPLWLHSLLVGDHAYTACVVSWWRPTSIRKTRVSGHTTMLLSAHGLMYVYWTMYELEHWQHGMHNCRFFYFISSDWKYICVWKRRFPCLSIECWGWSMHATSLIVITAFAVLHNICLRQRIPLLNSSTKRPVLVCTIAHGK